VASAYDDCPDPVGVVLVDAAGGRVRLETESSVGQKGRDRSIYLQMHWLASDPLTVWIEVSARPDHPALPRGSWVVLRDFLRYGLEVPTGDGDVQITPSEDGLLVHLDLALPQRTCRVQVPGELLAKFLDHTEKQVPLGEERSDHDLEAFIAKLLT